MSIAFNEVTTLGRNIEGAFVEGISVIPLYRRTHYTELGSRYYRYRVCLATDFDIRTWAVEEDFAPQPEATCGCGSQEYHSIDDIKECKACGNIIVGRSVIPNKEPAQRKSRGRSSTPYPEEVYFAPPPPMGAGGWSSSSFSVEEISEALGLV